MCTAEEENSVLSLTAFGRFDRAQQPPWTLDSRERRVCTIVIGILTDTLKLLTRLSHRYACVEL